LGAAIAKNSLFAVKNDARLVMRQVDELFAKLQARRCFSGREKRRQARQFLEPLILRIVLGSGK